MDSAGQVRRGFKNCENELKYIHCIFETDDDDNKSNNSGKEADDGFYGFHDWRWVLFLRQYSHLMASSHIVPLLNRNSIYQKKQMFKNRLPKW